ncbi:MAG TPA: penicillin acylase family protein [Anaerolineae bacterium]|nr:penicillin acylase family protein [Anaerolineae bacterium]
MMRTRTKVLLGIVVFIIALGLVAAVAGWLAIRRPWPKVAGTIQVDGLQAETTVIRDSWGVPHIYAANPHDLFFAQGYVHAQDRFWQMEFWRRVGSGRLAEILGESALGSDLFIRTLGWHRTAAQELELLDDELRGVLDAYSEGVNGYISANRGRLGLEFTILGLTGVRIDPEPWTPLNTLTWAKVMAWDLSGNMGADLLRAHFAARLGTGAVAVLGERYPEASPFVVPNPAAESSGPSAPDSASHVLTEATLGSLPDSVLDTHFLGSGDGVGSNNWVVAGSRTETGMPLLADDTHLGIQMPSIWYEVGLHCEPVTGDCPYQVVGFSFAGAPGVIIGHNDHIAWGVTNLGPDVQDLFIERVNPANPNQYEFQGEWLDMTIIREEIIVAGSEDDEPVVARIRLTRHGPIINDAVGGPEEEWSFGWQPLALSWTGLQPGTLFRSVLLLDRARNWEEFRTALSLWDVPSQNFVYADVEGNIGYQAPGRIPIRAAGNGSMPVPGWTGDHEWIGYIPYNELPRSFNPPEGYIVSANNAVVSPDFPHFISLDWAPGYRAQRIIELIEADLSLSVTDMQDIQGDSSPLWAQSILPALRSLPVPEEPRLAQALDMLRTWDGRAVRDSGGAALFESFERHFVDLTFGDELGFQLLERARYELMVALEAFVDEQASPWFDDINTLQTESRDDVLLRALEEAVEELTESLGKNMGKWRWGDLHTATFRNQSLGESGIGLIEALFNRGPVPVDGSSGTVNATGYRMSKPYGVSHVTSQRQIVDLSDFQRSVTMHTTGQSGHPFHRHYDDMIDPWRNIEYHAMQWDRSSLEEASEGLLLLQPLSDAR